MNIENFDHLLQSARAQQVPQRLLFVFVDVELPDDAGPEQLAGFEAGEGGALVPSACVDKSPEELSNFDALVLEAGQFAPDWRFVFAAALSGSTVAAPDSEIVEKSLQDMVSRIKQGDIAQYLPFDWQGHAVKLG